MELRVTGRVGAAPDDDRRLASWANGNMLLMMSERARKLLQDAMELSLPERAELATDLLASLDGEPDGEVEQAWEVERRAREALADPDDDIAWEPVPRLMRDEQAVRFA
jgi:putative addiction module component (TIGR02574 family)